MKSNVKRSSLILFFVLSFGLAWVLMGTGVANHQGLISVELPFGVLLVFGSWIPNIAALIVLTVVLKAPGEVKALVKSWARWNVGLGWYIVALSPVLVAFLAIGLYKLVNGVSLLAVGIFEPSSLLVVLLSALVTGATGEELGWRGFALPRLQDKMSSLMASIVLGAAWSVWHLPLWFAGVGFESMSFWMFTVIGVSFSIVVTWACNKSGGGLFIASLAHLFLNVSLALFEQELLLYYTVIIGLLAILVALKEGLTNVWIPAPKSQNNIGG